MLRQFKCISFFSLLIFSSCLLGQDSISSYTRGEVDNINKKLLKEFRKEIEVQSHLFKQIISEQNRVIDSMRSDFLAQDSVLQILYLENKMLEKSVSENEVSVARNKNIIFKEQRKFRRILWVTVPSMLLLIILTSILFLLLLKKSQAQTEEKMNALKSLTHAEIEVVRNDLLKGVKRKIKRLAIRLKEKPKKQRKKRKK